MNYRFSRAAWVEFRAFILILGVVCAGSLSSCPATAKATEQRTGSKQQSARELARQVLAAYGGLEGLRGLQQLAFRCQGTVSSISALSGAANSFDAQMLIRDHKIRVEASIMGQPVTLGYDGKTSWTKFGDWVSTGSETTARRLADELRHGLYQLLTLGNPNTKLSITGRKVINGRPCICLEAVAEDHKPTSFYVDEGSYLVDRSQYLGVDQEQGAQASLTTDYLDYRPIAGSWMAYKSIDYSNGKRIGETVLKKVEAGIDLDDRVFEKPKEIEIARLKDGPVSIPFDYVANQIVLKVTINHRPGYKFILDTGASQCVLDKATAMALGELKLSNFSITAGGDALAASYTTISNLGLGDLTLDDVPVLVTDLGRFSRMLGERPAGLIGANVLRRFLVTIDFHEKVILLSDPHKVDIPEDAFTVSTAPVFGATALVVKGKVDNKVDLNFLVDTGATFNKLPALAAEPAYSGPMLPVGQVWGLDGKKVDICSIKVNSLKLGDMKVMHPVFALSPAYATHGGAGLFGSGSLGILGNPVWSQYRMTVDYRNERLILESAPSRAVAELIKERLDQVFVRRLRTKNVDQAIRSYESISQLSASKSYKPGVVLAVLGIADCYREKHQRTGESRFLSLASAYYQQASNAAKEAHDPSIQGQVLARWGEFALTEARSQADLKGAQYLMAQAASLSPSEPQLLAALGMAGLKKGTIGNAWKLFNQCLMLDPSNVVALSGEYQIFKLQGKTKEMKMVLAQFAHYYPGADAGMFSGAPRTVPARRAVPGR